jgi:hypothetical protein
VLVLNDNPDGSAGLIAKLRVPKPPDAVTGVKFGAFTPTVKDATDTA